MVVTPVEAHEFLPALVIAVRGTANKIDHMVNANMPLRSADKYLVGGMQIAATEAATY